MAHTPLINWRCFNLFHLYNQDPSIWGWPKLPLLQNDLLVMCCPRPCSGFQAGGRNDHLPLSCQNFSDLQASKNLWNNLRKGRSSLNIVFPSSKCLPKCGCFQDSTHWWDEFSLAEWRTSRHPHATGTPSSWATKSVESQHPWQLMWKSYQNVWYWFPCKPTYPIQKDRWEDEFPFPLVAYILLLWLVPTASKRLCFQDVATSTCQSPSLPAGNPIHVPISGGPGEVSSIFTSAKFSVASFDYIRWPNFPTVFWWEAIQKQREACKFMTSETERMNWRPMTTMTADEVHHDKLPPSLLHLEVFIRGNDVTFCPGHQQQNMCQVAASMTSLFRVFPGFNALQNRHALAWSAQVEGKKNTLQVLKSRTSQSLDKCR